MSISANKQRHTKFNQVRLAFQEVLNIDFCRCFMVIFSNIQLDVKNFEFLRRLVGFLGKSKSYHGHFYSIYSVKDTDTSFTFHANHIWRVPCSISRYLICLQIMKIFQSKEKRIQIQTLSVKGIRFDGYSKSKECCKSKYVLNKYLNLL